MQADTSPTTNRRALMSGLALALVPTATIAATPDGAVLELDRRRTMLLAQMDALSMEDHGAEELLHRLCDELDRCSEMMTSLPTRTPAGALAKMRCINQLYDHPMHEAGWDKRLFEQVMSYLQKAAA